MRLTKAMISFEYPWLQVYRGKFKVVVETGWYEAYVFQKIKLWRTFSKILVWEIWMSVSLRFRNMFRGRYLSFSAKWAKVEWLILISMFPFSIRKRRLHIKFSVTLSSHLTSSPQHFFPRPSTPFFQFLCLPTKLSLNFKSSIIPVTLWRRVTKLLSLMVLVLDPKKHRDFCKLMLCLDRIVTRAD